MKKNKFIIYCFLFCFSSRYNCKSDANVNDEFTTKGSSNTETQYISNSKEDLKDEGSKKLTEDLKDEGSKKSGDSNKKVASPPLKEEPISVKIIEKTPCESLYDTYKESVEKYVVSKELSDLDKILNFSNSESFENCRKQNSFKEKFDLLDEKMESVEN